MFKQSILILAAVALSSAANAAVFLTFSGQPTPATAKQSDGTTLTPIGTSYLIVVDTGSAGFAESTTNTITANSSTALNSTLAGDTIVYKGATSTAGRLNNQQAAGNTFSSVDLAAYVGKQFAIMWFDSNPGAALADGTKYGLVTDASWIVPAVSNTYSFVASGATGLQFNQGAPTSANLVVGVAPEPSRALLLGLGSLGLMVRRRRA